ncbi:efflux RND transporter periplasmic adaptor subunit [Parapedomonas caeni]
MTQPLARHVIRQLRAAVPGLAVAALLAGCGGDPTPATPESTAPVIAVAVAEPAAGTATARATGTVRLRREADLAFKVGGVVARVLVDAGTPVRAGQVLAALDTMEVEAGRREAAANRDKARAELARVEKLVADGWATTQRLEAAQAADKAAAAQLDTAAFNLRWSVLRAPTDGVVQRRLAEPGQVLSPGTPVLRLGKVDQGYVLEVPLSDAQLATVRLGDTLPVELDGVGQQLSGKIIEVAARSDDRTGTFDVRIALPAAPGLRSGLIGDALVPTRRDGAATMVAIPAMALMNGRADEAFIYVVDPKSRVARSRRVALRSFDDQWAIVSAGLAAGEQVVVAGTDRVRDGMKITPRLTPATGHPANRG